MNAGRVTILLVEDNPGDQRLVKEILDDCGHGGFRLLVAEQIGTAAPLLVTEKVDVILLDLILPDGHGLDSLVKMRALAPDVPVVVLSHVEDETLAVKAVRSGAQDFLVKAHINGPLLLRSLRYAIERRQLEEHLYHMAHHDALTGLPNRKLFYEQLSRAIAQARRHRRSLALMLIDLNSFKQVNDTFGHQAGDDLLKQVAGRLVSCVRASDCVARLGGDEFVLYVTDLLEAEHASAVAQKLLDVLRAPVVVCGREFASHASIGIAQFPDDGDDLEALIKAADSAMYAAKDMGRELSRFRYYSRDADAAAAARMETEEALRRAFDRGEYLVDYQPQVDLHSRKIVGVEALLRWQRGDETLLPADFMPVMEESGLIVAVGEWVLSTACHQAMEWRAAGLPAMKVSVNLSARQFRDPMLPDRVARALRESGLEPALLELEIAEDSLRDDEDLAVDVLARLNDLGVHLALDNYHAGSPTLRDLKRFPIHTVKLDRSIVGDLGDNPEDAAIIDAVISVAHVFSMRGIAGGVETQRQADWLRQHACDDAQGYAFCRPLSAA
ncbi:MAG TPA: EAL domain-containing protein, partial [Rhodocyclaceae bacterium]|nr:EAL domain-containing protein [Rhodocyclaceae bacterium]